MSNFATFQELDIPAPLKASLEKMAFTTPTPIQAGTISAALTGKDVLGTAQTGTGKTGAFGIPMLSRLYPNPGTQALIMVPTRELAAQVNKVIRQMADGLKLRGTVVVGGESFYRQKKDLANGVDYIVATPGRLHDHLTQRTLSLAKISILVLDEADRMLDMGFAPQIEAIAKFLPPTRQAMLFSATLPKEVEKVAQIYLKDPVRVSVGSLGKPIADIKEESITTTQGQKNDLLVGELEKREGLILVFVRTKVRAERLARLLEMKGHKVSTMHGGRTHAARKFALEKFRSGECRVMVATDLAGRGIDIPDIMHVINFDTPETREDYIHRVGRTGRFGKTGNALNFIVRGDQGAARVVGGKDAKPDTSHMIRQEKRRFAAAAPTHAAMSYDGTIRPDENGYDRYKDGDNWKGGRTDRRTATYTKPRGEGRPSAGVFDRREPAAPQEGGFARREGGPREGGFARREGGPRREGGFARREGGPREGGFARREGGARAGGFAGRGATPRPVGFPERSGGFVRREGPAGGFARREGGKGAGGFVRHEGAPREGGFQNRNAAADQKRRAYWRSDDVQQKITDRRASRFGKSERPGAFSGRDGAPRGGGFGRRENAFGAGGFTKPRTEGSGFIPRSHKPFRENGFGGRSEGGFGRREGGFGGGFKPREGGFAPRTGKPFREGGPSRFGESAGGGFRKDGPRREFKPNGFGPKRREDGERKFGAPRDKSGFKKFDNRRGASFRPA